MRETFAIGDAIPAFERTTDFAEWTRDEFTPGDVLRVDADGAVIEGQWPPAPGVDIALLAGRARFDGFWEAMARRELRLDPSLLEHVDR